MPTRTALIPAPALLLLALLLALLSCSRATALDPRAASSIDWYACGNTDEDPFPGFDPSKHQPPSPETLSDGDLVDLMLQVVTHQQQQPRQGEDSPAHGSLTRSLMSAVMGNRWTRDALLGITDGAHHLQQIRHMLAKTTMPGGRNSPSPASLASLSAAAASEDGHATVGVREAQCAKIKVPLLWDKEGDQRTIDYFVKKFPATDPEKRKGQLWLQQGGPGGSGEVFDVYAPVLGALLNGEYDIIVPDHRGTGRSTFFTCSGSRKKPHMHRDKIRRCMEELEKKWTKEGMAAFSVTNAAKDILHVMKLIEEGTNDEIVFYGVSYGTYIANRVLQVEAKMVDKVIVDSMAAPGSFNFVDWDVNANSVGMSFLAKCDESKVCSERMKELNVEDSVSVSNGAMLEFYNRITSNKACYAPSHLALARRTISSYLADSELRERIAPLIYREIRCNANDVVVMDNWDLSLDINMFVAPISSGPYWEAASASYALLQYIGSVELSDSDGIKEEYVKRAVDNSLELLFADGNGYLFWNSTNVIKDMGVGYQIENEYKDKLVSTEGYTGPMLMFHGTLDPQTTLEQAEKWEERFKNPESHLITFTNGLHGAIINSITADGTPCALKIMADFIRSPNLADVDDSCVQETLDAKMDFTGANRTSALKWFGGDLWDGSPRLSTRNWLRIIVALTVGGVVLLLCFFSLIFTVCLTCIVRARNKNVAKDKFAGVKYSQLDTEEVPPFDI